jgi:hypothetical protein
LPFAWKVAPDSGPELPPASLRPWQAAQASSGVVGHLAVLARYHCT